MRPPPNFPRLISACNEPDLPRSMAHVLMLILRDPLLFSVPTGPLTPFLVSSISTSSKPPVWGEGETYGSHNVPFTLSIRLHPSPHPSPGASRRRPSRPLQTPRQPSHPTLPLRCPGPRWSTQGAITTTTTNTTTSTIAPPRRVHRGAPPRAEGACMGASRWEDRREGKGLRLIQRGREGGQRGRKGEEGLIQRGREREVGRRGGGYPMERRGRRAALRASFLRGRRERTRGPSSGRL